MERPAFASESRRALAGSGAGCRSACAGVTGATGAPGFLPGPGSELRGRGPGARGSASRRSALQRNGVIGSSDRRAPSVGSASAERNAGTVASGTSIIGAAALPAGSAAGARGATIFGGLGPKTGRTRSAIRAAPPVDRSAGVAGGVRPGSRGSGGVALPAAARAWAPEATEGAAAAPQARSSVLRATGAGGGRTSVKETSGSSGGAGGASRLADASKTSLQWPQRTQPCEMRS